jgi:hypothetical protein
MYMHDRLVWMTAWALYVTEAENVISTVEPLMRDGPWAQTELNPCVTCVNHISH